MSQHEPESRSSAGLAGQGHWSFTAPSATLTTQPWSEPSTLLPLRTVSTIEAPSLRGAEVLRQPAPRPDLTDPLPATMPTQELPSGRLDGDVIDGDVLEDDELVAFGDVHGDGLELPVHLSFEEPESSAWRPPAPVGGEPATITFEDETDGEEVVGRRPVRSELGDPMKILQGVAGVIVMILIASMT